VPWKRQTRGLRFARRLLMTPAMISARQATREDGVALIPLTSFKSSRSYCRLAAFPERLGQN
jgi:hypothetical protein